MRFPPKWSMEAVLVIALAVSVIVIIFAIQEPPGDRTRFTLERSDAAKVIGERRVPMYAEETGLGR
jgi:hypothetical protein